MRLGNEREKIEKVKCLRKAGFVVFCVVEMVVEVTNPYISPASVDLSVGEKGLFMVRSVEV